MTKYFIYDADYLESIRLSNKLLFCSVCDYVLEWPVCCCECQDIMCLACVKSIDHNCTDVPTTSKHSINGNAKLQIYLLKLNVKCALNHKNGCQWKGTREEYPKHIIECETIYSKCEFCDEHIDKNSTEHYDNNCPSYKQWILTNDPDPKIAACIKHLLNHNESMQKQIDMFENRFNVLEDNVVLIQNQQLLNLEHHNEATRKQIKASKNQINSLENKVATLVSSSNNYGTIQTKFNDLVLKQNQRLLNLEHYDRFELKVTESFDIAKIIANHHKILKNISSVVTYRIFFSIASVTLPPGIWNIINCSALDNIRNSKLFNKFNEMEFCTNKYSLNHCTRSACCANNKCNKNMGCINIISTVIKYHNYSEEIINKFKNGLCINSGSGFVGDHHNININCAYDDPKGTRMDPPIVDSESILNEHVTNKTLDNSDSYYNEICIGLTICINKSKAVELIANTTGKYVIDANICKSRIIAQRIA